MIRVLAKKINGKYVKDGLENVIDEENEKD